LLEAPPALSASSYIIPSTVQAIGGYAFYGCNNVTSITIPSSVIFIEDWAFTNCSNLSSVNLSSAGVSYIGTYSFSNTSLTSVDIPSSVTSIGAAPFLDCSSLTTINVDTKNSKYSSDSSGVLFDKSQTTLLEAPGALRGTYAIPSTVVTIADYAFEYCTSLTEVFFGTKITTIGDYAFSSAGLTSVQIPATITSIGDEAFYICSSLANAYEQATSPPTLGSAAFDCEASGFTLYVPLGDGSTYRTATGWSNYASEIQEEEG